jgi:hypothetical protein
LQKQGANADFLELSEMEQNKYMFTLSTSKLIKNGEVCQLLVTGRWFSPVSSTNKTDRHDITEILLKVALNNINHSPI